MNIVIDYFCFHQQMSTHFKTYLLKNLFMAILNMLYITLVYAWMFTAFKEDSELTGVDYRIRIYARNSTCKTFWVAVQ